MKKLVPRLPFIFVFMCMNALNVCMSVYYMCMLGTPRGQERASNFLRLELQMVESHHVCVGNQT